MADLTRLEEIERKIDAMNDEISAMHRTLGVLLDDVAEQKAMMIEVNSIRLAMSQMATRVRKLEGNGKAA